MKPHIALAAVVVLCFGTPRPSRSQSHGPGCQENDLSRMLCDTEAALTEALRQNDSEALGQIYAENFQLINFRGRRVNKPGVLAAISSGTLRFDSLTTSELEVQIFGTAALITGRQHQVAREPGPDPQAHPKDVRFTHVYILSGSRWRLVASQITPIAPAMP